jgi:hypothetical protein
METFRIHTQNPSTSSSSISVFKPGIILKSLGTSNTISIEAPSDVKSSYNIILPSTDGTIGQVLKKIDNIGNLGWSDSTDRRDFVIQSLQVNVSSVTPIDVAFFAWDQSQYGYATASTITYYLTGISNAACTLSVYNNTTNLSLGSQTIPSGSSIGIKKLIITNPTSDTRLSFRVNKSSANGINPQIYGIQLNF